MFQEAGHCGKCGAPYYVESPWYGVTPPPPTPTCHCWNNTVITSTNTLPVLDLDYEEGDDEKEDKAMSRSENQ